MSKNQRIEPTLTDIGKQKTSESTNQSYDEHLNTDPKEHSLPFSHIPSSKVRSTKTFAPIIEERLSLDIIFISVLYILFGLTTVLGLLMFPAQTYDLFDQFLNQPYEGTNYSSILPFSINNQTYLLSGLAIISGLFLAFGLSIGWGLTYFTLILAITNSLQSLYITPIPLGDNWLPKETLGLMHILTLSKLAVFIITLFLFSRRRVLKYFNIGSTFSVIILLISSVTSAVLFFNSIGLISIYG